MEHTAYTKYIKKPERKNYTHFLAIKEASITVKTVINKLN